MPSRFCLGDGYDTKNKYKLPMGYAKEFIKRWNSSILAER